MNRFLSICPRIEKVDGQLVAATGRASRIATLGMSTRRVAVDPTARTVNVTSRYVWLLPRRRELAFNQVKAVTYGREDMSLGEVFSSADHSFDWFKVGLRLRDETELHLFNFIGGRIVDNNGPAPEWFQWDNFKVDLSGAQEKESRLFVNVLSKMLAVTVAPPRK